MQIFPDVSIGDTISFTVYPSTIIGTTFNYCSIIAVLDYKTAQKFIDIDTLHANVYPTLPDTVPNNPAKYSYLKIALPSEQDTIIGLPWVDEGSIEKHEKSRIRFTIENVTSNDLNKISSLLSANGYHGVDWDIEIMTMKV